MEETVGIDLKLQKTGTTLLLEAENSLFEIVLRYPEHGILEIQSNRPPLKRETICQFIHALVWPATGGISTLSAPACVNMIVPRCEMVLRFSNGEWQTPPILSARILGVREDWSRWYYDVF